MRKTLVAVCIVCSAVVVAGLLKGCASEQRPLPLNSSEQTLLSSNGFGLSLGVEPSTPPVYAQTLLRALRQTKLFREVQPAEKVQGPDLLVRVERPITGNAVIPILSLITLGLIPTVTEEEHGYSFSLRSLKSSEPVVIVEYVHRGYTVLGWVAGLLNFFPHWTGDGVHYDPRFNERLKLAILTKAQEIKAVTSQ
ncbi:MAG: hypothetical protein EWM72_03460 [Nitrospira sp.]|nr:MAG: hypothetical protein EWM72_03460 [Nitrospira sp.]